MRGYLYFNLTIQTWFARESDHILQDQVEVLEG